MKTYKMWEVIKLLEENPRLKFKQGGTIIGVDENGWITLLSSCGLKESTDLFRKNVNSIWAIIQEPVDFMTAVNSGKQIKPVSLDKEKAYHPYTYWLGFMVSSLAYKELNPLDLINGKWYIEE